MAGSRRPRSGVAAVSKGLEVVRVAIDALHEDPANARKHGEENLAAIRASLQEFGQVVPLVVLKGAGRVIGGNGTLREMRKLGWTEVDVVEFEGTESRATALAIALNRSAELAEWDEDVLKKTLASLRADDFNVDATGFDQAAVDELINEALAAAAEPASEPEQVAFQASGKEKTYTVGIECTGESQQTTLLLKLEAIAAGKRAALKKADLEGATVMGMARVE